jgi:Uma2 family endonuclease
VWVIQPNKQIVAVFRQGQAEPETIQPDGELDGEDVIPGFKLSLKVLFEDEA